ncbi:MAG: hypothetical protein WCJ37_00510 [Syntrophus sp. (in: bacteria)]
MRITSILTILMLYLVLIVAPVFAEPPEVGIFLRLEENCSVMNMNKRGEIDCSKGLGLRNGDSIMTSQDPNTLKIQWISKSVRLDGIAANTYRVVYTAPKDKKGTLETVLNVLGFTRTASRVSALAVTRGPKPLQPGPAATLVIGMPTIFAGWSDKATRFVIRNAAGTVVHEQPAANLSEIRLLPEKAGLKHGNTYTWKAEESMNEALALTILDEKTTDVINEVFATIDGNATLTLNDKIFAKAANSLYLTENNPQEVSLGWLTYQLVDQMEGLTTKEDVDMALYLKIQSGIL